MQNFPQQIQTQLSQKRKAFSGFSIAFLKFTSSLAHFEKKDKPSSLSIPEILDSEGPYFGTRLGKQRVSRLETLLK